MTTIFITGSTDGIGLATAKRLATEGHRIVLHGRNPEKLAQAERDVEGERIGAVAATFAADLSQFEAVDELARASLAASAASTCW